jgi:hypothetical protein
MTARTESTLRAILVGAGTALLIAVASAAWSSKESKAGHDLDVARVRAEQSETRALVQRVLDAICEKNPGARTCSQ